MIERAMVRSYRVPTYRPLPQAEYRHGAYRLVPIRYEDREPIRAWRNAQLQVLRQAAPLTAEQQETYFQRVVLPLFEQEQPGQLLFSLLHEDELIAYGGLVHISWADLRAEVSFLVEPTRATQADTYRQDFLAHLRLLGQVAFEGLKFNRLFTETYDIRPAHIAILVEAGFQLEGRLRQHIQLAPGTFTDSLMHGQLAADYATAFGTAL
ncbi:GNAT family N-acetyltransferase [Hymenobacter negativus]|uniref:GNAT family N-acetyltransferase n=1 Tax=Hymenobacter negativus TaxID=2795026 RepID=A0ABS0Q2G1_9BACT|nr:MULTISPECIES: GNAT family N-acetyltransferase [Bacteria]MBH8556707.1 GNAT family N-acetyltransferase [Hymenobacter negativus]MBH8571231.1 GNAT family N-acetyltransferase [Hymenobacter negativus]MBR7210968.1 GNAT family N-acetyltransferase [Microvirga sp. STS02]